MNFLVREANLDREVAGLGLGLIRDEDDFTFGLFRTRRRIEAAAECGLAELEPTYQARRHIAEHVNLLVAANEEAVKQSLFILVRGKLEKDGVINVVGQKFKDLKISDVMHRARSFR